MKTLKWMVVTLGVMLLAGCNTDPSTRVAQPMTIRPNPAPVAMERTGAIYRAADSRPLFEDRRARFVGDIITVNIVEKTSATKSTNESSSRSGSANVNIPTPTILGYTPRPPFNVPVPGGRNDIGGLQVDRTRHNNFDSNWTADASLKFENKESGGNSNNFSGSITVTVIEVLPNGNLRVSGEKQIAINQNTEFIRLSGVVNPIDIMSGNVVNSTQLADARIETKGKQSVDTAQIVSMLSRFFVTLLPF